MPFPEVLSRFAIAALLTTCVCVPLGFVAAANFRRAADVSAAVAATNLLRHLWRRVARRARLLVALRARARQENASRRLPLSGHRLCLASFQLAFRLSYTKSPRFAGVTLAAQIGQCLLHTIVVFLSAICFLTENSVGANRRKIRAVRQINAPSRAGDSARSAPKDWAKPKFSCRQTFFLASPNALLARQTPRDRP